MTALRSVLAARRLADENGTWALLRSSYAPIAVAILAEHLAGDVKRRLAPQLFALVDADLEDLRAHGFELPGTAQNYCRTWLNAGYLVRRTGEGREETYELAEAALTAIRFVQQLDQPRATATQSRLATILDRLRRLSLATDPDRATRLAALEAERDRIDADIAAVAAGRFDVLADDRATEQALDVLALADELPEDFARVRQAMERLSRDLRAKLVEEPESRGAVLDDIFRGVDLLADSDAGRTFTAFHALLLDAERNVELEETIASLLTRGFVERLSPGQARSLRHLLPSLHDASSQTHQVMTSFNRSLRRFVAGQELVEDRRVHRLLATAQADAAALTGTVKPYQQLQVQLDLTSVSVSRLAGLRLHNPADSQTAEPVVARAAPPVDLAALREVVRASEIDLRELADNVNAVLHERGAATVGEVLAARPASQGVASVVGLLVLAEEHASRLADTEIVSWSSDGGAVRSGTVPVYLFGEALP